MFNRGRVKKRRERGGQGYVKEYGQSLLIVGKKRPKVGEKGKIRKQKEFGKCWNLHEKHVEEAVQGFLVADFSPLSEPILYAYDLQTSVKKRKKHINVRKHTTTR